MAPVLLVLTFLLLLDLLVLLGHSHDSRGRPGLAAAAHLARPGDSYARLTIEP
jgi:hypothetical protein